MGVCVCVKEKEKRERRKRNDFVAKIKKLCQKRGTGPTYQGWNVIWTKKSQSFVEKPNVINCIWRALDFCTNFSTRSNWKCYSHSQGHSKKQNSGLTPFLKVRKSFLLPRRVFQTLTSTAEHYKESLSLPLSLNLLVLSPLPTHVPPFFPLLLSPLSAHLPLTPSHQQRAILEVRVI